MKRMIALLIIIPLLAACAPVATPEPTQTATLTPEPTRTVTLTPEQTPTIVPYAAPEYLPTSVGEVPESIQSEWRDQVASLNDALSAKGIDPATVNYLLVSWSKSFFNSANGQLEYRWGTIIQLKSNPNVIYWARYTDGAKEFTLRPDMRPVSREWKFEQVTVPAGFGPTVQLRAYFPDGQDVPHVYLVDTSIVNAQGQPKVIAEFNRDTGIFYNTVSGEILTPPPPPEPKIAFAPPPSLEQFPWGEKTKLLDYIAWLRTQPSHLTPGSTEPSVSETVSNTFTGAAHVGIGCNENGIINCAPVAFLQFKDQGLDIHVIIWEIRNRDGSRGYLVNYFQDPQQVHGEQYYLDILAEPNGRHGLTISMGVPYAAQAIQTYKTSLITQAYKDFIAEWRSSGNIPIYRDVNGNEIIFIVP